MVHFSSGWSSLVRSTGAPLSPRPYEGRNCPRVVMNFISPLLSLPSQVKRPLVVRVISDALSALHPFGAALPIIYNVDVTGSYGVAVNCVVAICVSSAPLTMAVTRASMSMGVPTVPPILSRMMLLRFSTFALHVYVCVCSSTAT